jgi:hypothetical protein
MPTVPKDYIHKSETHTQISVYVLKETLEALETLIPRYKRGQLIDTLLRDFVLRHSQDPVYSQSVPKPKETKKK